MDLFAESGNFDIEGIDSKTHATVELPLSSMPLIGLNRAPGTAAMLLLSLVTLLSTPRVQLVLLVVLVLAPSLLGLTLLLYSNVSSVAQLIVSPY